MAGGKTNPTDDNATVYRRSQAVGLALQAMNPGTAHDIASLVRAAEQIDDFLAGKGKVTSK